MLLLHSLSSANLLTCSFTNIFKLIWANKTNHTSENKYYMPITIIVQNSCKKSYLIFATMLAMTYPFGSGALQESVKIKRGIVIVKMLVHL